MKIRSIASFFVTLISLVLLLFTCSAFAEQPPTSGVCGEEVYWELTPEGELIISGNGYVYDYSITTYHKTPWYDFRNDITSITAEEGVTAIGNYSLTHTNAVSLSLPSTLEEIGNYAFLGSAKLKEISIPESVRTVGMRAFEECTSLEEITVPETVEYLGSEAFRECTGLKKAVINAKGGDFSELFLKCTSLTEVSIGTKLTSIPQYMFSTCTSLEKINLPSTVTSIGPYAFQNCESLAYIILPDGVTTVGSYAFYNCPSLAYMVVPESVESFSDYALGSCSTGLWHVLYKGSKNQWEAVQKGYSNTCLNEHSDHYAHVHFNCGGDEINEQETGDNRFECSLCGEGFVRGTKVFRHDMGDWRHLDPATSGGITHRRECSTYMCNYEERLSDPITYSDWSVEKEPDCIFVGLKRRYCNVCGRYEEEHIPAVPHKFEYPCSKECAFPNCETPQDGECEYGEFLFDDESHYRECIYCHTMKDKGDHEYENGVCTVCGYSAVSSSVSSEAEGSEMTSSDTESSEMTSSDTESSELISSEATDTSSADTSAEATVSEAFNEDKSSGTAFVIAGLFALAVVCGVGALLILKMK